MGSCLITTFAAAATSLSISSAISLSCECRAISRTIVMLAMGNRLVTQGRRMIVPVLIMARRHALSLCACTRPGSLNRIFRTCM